MVYGFMGMTADIGSLPQKVVLIPPLLLTPISMLGRHVFAQCGIGVLPVATHMRGDTLPIIVYLNVIRIVDQLNLLAHILIGNAIKVPLLAQSNMVIHLNLALCRMYD